MKNRRKFIGLITSVSTMSIAGCISSEPEEQELDYITSNEDNTLLPEEWENTDNYEEKHENDYTSSLDVIQESDKLIIYTSSHAPQSNYKLAIDNVYVDNTQSDNPIIVNGSVTNTDSDVGLTVITEVETVTEVSTEQEHSKVIFNVSDGFYDSYSIETMF